MGFERFFEWIESVWEWLIPFVVIDQDFRGVVLRLGHYRRTLDAGFHWVIPFGVESVRTDCITPRLRNLDTQSLTTADKVKIVISAVVTARIINIRKALLEVEDVDAAIADSCLGVIGEYVRLNNWRDVCDSEFAEVLQEECHRQAIKFGIRISRFQVTDLSPSRTYRLLT